MKKRVFDCFCIVVSSVLFSCSSKSGYTVELCSDLSPIDSLTRNLNLEEFDKKEILFYSELYSNVEYVVLEVSPASTLGNIDHLFVTNDKEFIVHDRNNGKILRFSTSGKFINKIGEKGKGSNEYINAFNVQYDQYNEQVIVFDNYKKVFMVYDLLGKLLKVISAKYIARDFCVLDKEHYAIFVNRDESLKGKDIGHNFKVIDHEGNIISEFDSYSKEDRDFSPDCSHTFYRFDSIVYCKKPYSNTIRCITTGNMPAAYYLEFGNRAIPEEWLTGKLEQFNERISKHTDLSYCNNYYKYGDCFYFEIVKDRRIYLCKFNTQMNEVEAMGNAFINDLGGLLSTITCNAIEGNKVYKIIDPSMAIDVKTLLKSVVPGDHFTELPMLQKIDDQISISEMKYIKDRDFVLSKHDFQLNDSLSTVMNPIIQICTLK